MTAVGHSTITVTAADLKKAWLALQAHKTTEPHLMLADRNFLVAYWREMWRRVGIHEAVRNLFNLGLRGRDLVLK